MVTLFLYGLWSIRLLPVVFFFSSRRRHTRSLCEWSSDVCSSDLSISIDGLDNTDETTGAARVALSPEIVREFQIVNNGLSAEFGGAAGGAINVVTKTGANEWHGDVFTFLQNERFNARGPFSDSSQTTRPRFRRYQPGGALGGPLRRDRAFFYVALEQEHLTAEDEAETGRAARTRINTLLAS